MVQPCDWLSAVKCLLIPYACTGNCNGSLRDIFQILPDSSTEQAALKILINWVNNCSKSPSDPIQCSAEKGQETALVWSASQRDTGSPQHSARFIPVNPAKLSPKVFKKSQDSGSCSLLGTGMFLGLLVANSDCTALKGCSQAKAGRGLRSPAGTYTPSAWLHTRSSQECPISKCASRHSYFSHKMFLKSARARPCSPLTLRMPWSLSVTGTQSDLQTLNPMFISRQTTPGNLI